MRRGEKTKPKQILAKAAHCSKFCFPLHKVKTFFYLTQGRVTRIQEHSSTKIRKDVSHHVILNAGCRMVSFPPVSLGLADGWL